MPKRGEATPGATSSGEAPHEKSLSPREKGAPRVTFRAALVTDSFEIAQYLCAAGGGLYEFLFDELVPLMTANEFLTAGVASDKSPISYRNCLVATRTDDGRVVGAVNAFSAATTGSNGYRFVPRDRLDHIRPILQLQERDSLFLNALAVHESVRHQGVGTAFLSWARARAGLLGMPRLSLHVWADNMFARRFYEKQGFTQRGVAEVPYHPRLRHSGGSILMSQAI